jgi:hypothetical protein
VLRRPSWRRCLARSVREGVKLELQVAANRQAPCAPVICKVAE